LIAKVVKPKPAKKKKKKKVKKQVEKQVAPPATGLVSHGGSGAGFDFNESVKKGNTIGSEGGFVMQNAPPRGQTAKFPNADQSPIKQRPTDLKGQIKYDIEEERIKI
jgi:hypothetical protein